MDESDIKAELSAKGLVIDEGYLIDGPFIPDGWVRIYDPSDIYIVLGEGYDIKEAYSNYKMRCQYND